MEVNGVENRPGKTTEEIVNEIPERPVNGIEEIEIYVNLILNSLPIIDRNAWREEMLSMVVEIPKEPTTSTINKGLSLSQGYRERLSEMLIFAQKEARVRRRCHDMLLDMVNMISKGSSADKRKAEFTGRYPFIVLQTELAETFVKEIEQVYSNMKSNTDALSRQVSVMQLQMQLGEIRNFNNDFVDVSEEIENTNKVNYKSGNRKWSQI